MKEVWNSTCKEQLGLQKPKQYKKWITPDTIRLIEERRKLKTVINNSRTRATKSKAQESYTKLNKEVKRSTRNDKRNYFEGLATEAEEAVSKGNIKDMYNITKQLSGKRKAGDRPVHDREGNPLTTEDDQRNRWAQHFKELLNRPDPVNPPDILAATEDLQINCERPEHGEIGKAIKMLKNGKAVGPDGIPTEALKSGAKTSVDMLHSLFGKIWEQGNIPIEWKEAHIVKIPKKGNLADCNNYRGISLLSIPGKVLSRVILERIKVAVNEHLRDEQAGFRQNRSCSDQITTLRIIVEQSIEWNSSLYINFIDFEKAFDSVDRSTLWKILRHYGIPDKIVSLIKNLYDGMTCKIIHGSQLSEPFTITTGVRQGCLLSPLLFLLVIDWIMKRVTERDKNGIQWTMWKHLEDLDFADDIALLSHRQVQMQAKTTKLKEIAEKIGLKIHSGKTKILKINTNSSTPVIIDGRNIEEVTSFTYLGSIINSEGGTDEDIKIRIQKARAAFIMMSRIWKSKEIGLRTKIRLFNSNVKAVLLYGEPQRH